MGKDSHLPGYNVAFFSFVWEFFCLDRSNRHPVGILSVSCLEAPWLINLYQYESCHHKNRLPVLATTVRPSILPIAVVAITLPLVIQFWILLLWSPVQPTAFNLSSWAETSPALRSSTRKRTTAKHFKCAGAPLTVLRLTGWVKACLPSLPLVED